MGDQAARARTRKARHSPLLQVSRYNTSNLMARIQGLDTVCRSRRGWILNSAPHVSSLFLRRYPTVERRCKLLTPSLYHALPTDTQLCEAVITKCSEPTEKVWFWMTRQVFVCHISSSFLVRGTAVLHYIRSQSTSFFLANYGQWFALSR